MGFGGNHIGTKNISGAFVGQSLIDASLSIPTIALIEAGNAAQEIKAAQWGVTVVIPEDVDDDYFRRIVFQLLGIEEAAMVGMADNRCI